MSDFLYQPGLNTAGQRYVQPTIWNPTRTSSGVMGVWLSEDEDVDFHITTNPDGTQNCHGYTIKKKGQVIDHNELVIPPALSDEDIRNIIDGKEEVRNSRVDDKSNRRLYPERLII